MRFPLYVIRIETKLFVIRLCDCSPNRKNALKPFSFCVFILDFKSSLCLVRDESFSFYLVCMYFLFKYWRKAPVKSYFSVTFILVEYLWYAFYDILDWIQLHAFDDSKLKKQHEKTVFKTSFDVVSCLFFEHICITFYLICSQYQCEFLTDYYDWPNQILRFVMEQIAFIHIKNLYQLLEMTLKKNRSKLLEFVVVWQMI